MYSFSPWQAVSAQLMLTKIPTIITGTLRPVLPSAMALLF